LNKRKKRRPVKKSNTVQRKRNRMVWLLYLFMIPTGLGLVLALWPRRPMPSGPQFQKEGVLSFIRTADNEELVNIDIEIAEEELAIRQGLMYRQSMEPKQGMLFIMPNEEPQSFWMLNTYISLDIIFVNQNREIVKIQPNTQPRSLKPIPSEQPAIFVVEVLAGFCAKHGIAEGDRIQYQRL
jgi:uncharacterized membrane protein (UPF0127 family)